MDIYPIFLPVLVSYIVSTYCPFTPGFSPSTRIETPGEKIVRQNVWPVLSGTIGFAWSLTRNKAITVQAAKATKKGTRKAVSKLSKWFKGSHKYTLDFAYLLLIVAVNYWVWVYGCNKRKKDSFYVLCGTLLILFWVLYLTVSYTSSSMLLLTPLLVWLLFSFQHSAKEMYYANADDAENTEDIAPEVEEEDISHANKKLNNEQKELKEEFRIW